MTPTEFIEKLEKCETEDQVREAATEFNRELRSLYPNVNTRNNKLGAIRKLIQEFDTPQLIALEIIKLDPNESKMRRDMKDVSISRKLENVMDVDSKEFTQRGLELLKSSSFNALACGLIALSGRRPIEIFLTGDFEPCDDPNSAIFYGQAKTRGSSTIAEDGYRIPLLCDYQTFIKAFNHFRGLVNLPSDTTMQQFTNKYGKNLGSVCKRQFEGVVEGFDFTPKSLRAGYAAIAYLQRGKREGKRQKEVLFYEDVLGHGRSVNNPDKRDRDTPQSYQYFEAF